jgi:hypothetical protein
MTHDLRPLNETSGTGRHQVGCRPSDQQSLLRMSTTLTPTAPLFAVTRERSRAYLKWARRLAQAEALLLLFASCSLVDAGARDQSNTPFAIGAAAMAILWLTLGHFVGRGSARAAVTLLALSIARQIVAFLPGAAALANVVAPLFLADLFLYIQAARAAVVLAQPRGNPLDESVSSGPTVVKAKAPPVSTLSRPAATAEGASPQAFKWPVDWVESRIPEPPRRRIWEPNFRHDFIVASVLLAVAMGGFYKGAAVPDYHSGFEGLASIYYWVIALYHLALATLLFVAVYGARKGKSWANRARGVAYIVLLLEVLGWIRVSLGMA